MRIEKRVWGTYIDELIQLTTLATLGQQSLPAGAYYLLQDLLYRAVALTNSSGGVVEAYDTDAYGNTLMFTGTGTDGVWFTNDDVQGEGANNIVYCGYRYDQETSFYYVRNRNYSPTLGRWLQRDPIGYSAGINLYEYVGGRPVVAVDPMGMVESYVTHEGIRLGRPQVIYGPMRKLPSCPIGTVGCCASRTNSYRAFLGTITSTGSHSASGQGLLGEIAKAAVKGIANLVPEAKLVSLWTDNITINSVLYIWDIYATYTRAFTYSYCCGTNYQNLKFLSAATNDLRIIPVSANRSADDPNNVYLPGTIAGSKKHAIKSIWDALHELTTTLKGE